MKENPVPLSSVCMTIVTQNIGEACRFYKTCFAAVPTFDCGWYVTLEFPSGQRLCFMEPQNGATEYTGGAVLNIRVEDADAMHETLLAKGLSPVVPLTSNPWGDRGFSVMDPCGIKVYCYHDIPPDPSFAPSFLS